MTNICYQQKQINMLCTVSTCVHRIIYNVTMKEASLSILSLTKSIIESAKFTDTNNHTEN